MNIHPHPYTYICICIYIYDCMHIYTCAHTLKYICNDIHCDAISEDRQSGRITSHPGVYTYNWSITCDSSGVETLYLRYFLYEKQLMLFVNTYGHLDEYTLPLMIITSFLPSRMGRQAQNNQYGMLAALRHQWICFNSIIGKLYFTIRSL